MLIIYTGEPFFKKKTNKQMVIWFLLDDSGRKKKGRRKGGCISTRTVMSRVPHSVTGTSKPVCRTQIHDVEILENLKSCDVLPSLTYTLNFFFLRSRDNCIT